MPGYVIGNFFVYSVINAFTPGPGNILALNTVTNYGWKKGLPLFFGIFSGYYVVQMVCAVFVYGVSTSLPVLVFFELMIATIGTVATSAWIGTGLVIQKIYLRHYRLINIILAGALLECVYSILK